MAMKTLKTAKRVWGTWKMNTYESIITRRSTRKYLKKPVSQELLEKVIEAGRYAPSGGNSQSNHFIVIRDSEIIKELIALVEKAFSEMTFDENTYGSIRNSIIRSQKADIPSAMMHRFSSLLRIRKNTEIIRRIAQLLLKI